ncbi:hypothetical protein JYT97_03850, partial [Haliea sp. AH-315-K21]|nr:hypothetical protein [Haliea sp. AH-315-K21]
TLPAVHPLYLYRSSTKLVTNFGAAAAVEGNKFLNSAVYSGAEFQYENTATILSGIEGSALLAKYRGQYEDSSYILKKPFVLSPGVGLNFSSTLVNGIVSASYQYHSEKV